MSAGYPAVIEPRNLSEEGNKRPDGRTLSLWTKGKPLLWDYTCRDTVCSSYALKTSRKAGENRGKKINKLLVSKIGNKYPKRKCSLYFGHFASWKRIRRAVLLVIDSYRPM